jgi:myosin heavy subunit
MDGETKTVTDPKANGTGQASATETLQPGQAKASSGEAVNPSKTPPETYTAEQVAQRHSALDKKIASLTKSHELITRERDDISKRLNDIESAQRAREEAEAKSDPEKHKAWQQKEDWRKQMEAQKNELSAREAKIKEAEDKLNHADELEADMAYTTAAVENGLDIEAFKAKCQKFGMKTQEQINEFAKEIAKPGTAQTVPGTDTGKTVGGATGDISKVRSDYVAGKITRADYVARCKELGEKP